MIRAPARRVAVALIAGLAALGGGAVAMQRLQQAERGRGAFRISVVPRQQVAAPGERISYSVTIRRSRGFHGRVRLRVRGLPPRTRAIWLRNDGRRSSLVPARQDGAVLILRTSTSTPTGRRRMTVRASGGGRTRRQRFAVRLAPRASRLFSLAPTPRRRVVAPGQTATYRIRVARSPDFRRRVRLRVAALPAGTRAVRVRAGKRSSRRRLRIRVAKDAKPASARLVVTGRSRVGGRWIRRYTVVVLEVRRPVPFRIGGDLGARLYPGASVPLDLTLTNPHAFAIRITQLTVSVEAGTTRAGCGGSENFTVSEYAGPYPMRLAPGRTTLGELVPDRALWPRVAMLDLPHNQDACKGTGLTLRYEGTAVR